MMSTLVFKKGVYASRGNAIYFKHNDVNDLRQLLSNQADIDRGDPKKVVKFRRFVIIEEISLNTGEMCPLPEIVELCRHYKLRLIREVKAFHSVHCIRCFDSNSIFLFFNSQRDDVDIIISSWENAIGSIGGFSVGTELIIYNQYLHSRAHCFSALLSPFIAKAAISAIDHFEQNPQMFSELNLMCRKLHE